MALLARVVRILNCLVVLAFCATHVAALLEYNARYVGGDKALSSALGVESYDKLHDLAAKWCRATGTDQRWNMFSNVGSYSQFPCIVIVHKDGTRTLLHSPREPELPNLRPGANYLDSNVVSEHEREYGPSFNFGNGRVRKFEDNVIEGMLGYSAARMTYTRHRLLQHFRERPQDAATVARIDLVRLTLAHPDGERPPRLVSVEFVLNYDSRFDALWPKDLKLSHAP